MAPVTQYVFAEMRRKIETFHRREWCSAQRIRITMIASGNHSIIKINGSPTVFFDAPKIALQTPISRFAETRDKYNL